MNADKPWWLALWWLARASVTLLLSLMVRLLICMQRAQRRGTWAVDAAHYALASSFLHA
jgi:hypothetical protein